MNNLYDTPAYNEITERINRLSASSERKWGKMAVAQMLAHCKAAFQVPLSEKPMKRVFIGYILAPLIKKKLYNDAPWKEGLPTSPLFKITDNRDFDTEKKELGGMIDKFHNLGPDKTALYPHPVFGAFTKEQWGMSMYKHLDHHLRQFNV